MARPIAYQWTDDGVMRPLERFRALCDREFVIGEIYRLSENEEASDETRGHYFACIRRAWDNLPEALMQEYPTPEHLRKKALILCRYANMAQYACDNESDALRQAAFYAPLLDYSIITTKGNVVTVLSAKSQSRSAMPGKGDFQKSKQDVLEFCASLCGLTVEQLAKQENFAAAPSLAPAQEREREPVT